MKRNDYAVQKKNSLVIVKNTNNETSHQKMIPAVTIIQSVKKNRTSLFLKNP